VTIRVPADAPTISAAAALAHSGDLILVAPGVYHESVKITTADVTLRGESRNTVIIDGQIRQPNGVILAAPGDAVENLTVKNNTQNGILVTGSAAAVAGEPGSDGYDTAGEPINLLKSFLVDYVTASNNGLYGIYAFSAQDGTIENSYAAGGADSGIYVGQCKPCNIVVQNNIAELNAVGYEGTNASDGMYVVGNRLVGNRVGLTTDSDHIEQLLPQQNAVLAGNLVAGNAQPQTPEQADGGYGIGIGIAGGTGNQVLRNRIVDNPAVGLVVTSTEDLAPLRNSIIGNVFDKNGTDVAFAAPSTAPGQGNCLGDNTLASTIPSGLTAAARCPLSASAQSPSGTQPTYAAPPGIPFTLVAAPPIQPEMPAAESAGPTVVPPMPAQVVTARITVPALSLLAGTASVKLK